MGTVSSGRIAMAASRPRQFDLRRAVVLDGVAWMAMGLGPSRPRVSRQLNVISRSSSRRIGLVWKWGPSISSGAGFSPSSVAEARLRTASPEKTAELPGRKLRAPASMV